MPAATIRWRRQTASAGTNRGIEASDRASPAQASLGAGSTLGAGTLIAYATAPGQVALDGEGSNDRSRQH